MLQSQLTHISFLEFTLIPRLDCAHNLLFKWLVEMFVKHLLTHDFTLKLSYRRWFDTLTFTSEEQTWVSNRIYIIFVPFSQITCIGHSSLQRCNFEQMLSFVVSVTIRVPRYPLSHLIGFRHRHIDCSCHGLSNLLDFVVNVAHMLELWSMDQRWRNVYLFAKVYGFVWQFVCFQLLFILSE